MTTKAEWDNELALFAGNGGTNATGAFSLLKLTLPGYRYLSGSSNIVGAGTSAIYSGSTVSGSCISCLDVNATTAKVSSFVTANGYK